MLLVICCPCLSNTNIILLLYFYSFFLNPPLYTVQNQGPGLLFFSTEMYFSQLHLLNNLAFLSMQHHYHISSAHLYMGLLLNILFFALIWGLSFQEIDLFYFYNVLTWHFVLRQSFSYDSFYQSWIAIS